MKFRIFQLDAFTRRVFGGNPAAVVVLEDWPADSVLQAVAAENNLSETAFVLPRGSTFPLRWFTPTVEVDLCGHATLATADVLFREYCTELDRVAFATRSGELVVIRDGERLSMDLPSRPGREIEVTAALVEALGVRPRAAYLSRDLMAVFDSETTVRDFVPDETRIAGLDGFGLIVTGPGKRCDFVSRFFAPKAGILEDPATGSSHCILVPFWSEELGKKELTDRQLSARGAEFECRMEGERVTVSGYVVEYLRGEIFVD